MTLIAVIRLRGSAKKPKEINYALKIMGLTRVNHCVLLKDNTYNRGQINKVKDYITYGEIDGSTLKKLVEKRLRLIGNKKITEDFLKSHNLTIDTLIKTLEKDPKKIYGFGAKKVFRLSPASKGLKSIKLGFGQKGDLGYRGKEVNKLLDKMI